MIRTEGLSKSFEGFWAVRDLTLEVHPGEILALLGPNGAGKTTTVRMLSAVLRPSRGRAWIGGYEVTQSPDEVRSLVGVLTEQHGLYTRMTALEYLTFFARLYDLPPEASARRIRHWLTFFGLWEFRHQRIGNYSKGMRQKLALSRALLHHPQALLLDEPTSAMDPESARRVRQAIASLRSEERAIILCTHNLVEAETLADRIAILDQGRLVALGTPEELKDQALGPPRFRVVLAEPRTDPPPLPPGFQVEEQQPTSLVVRPPRGEADNPRLLRALLHAGWPVTRLEEVPRTLEDAYLALMERLHGKTESLPQAA